MGKNKISGPGIPLEKQDIIFEPFKQADASTTRQYGGTGLGLAISKNLIEMFGSNIKVKSNGVFGSTFIFSIPYIPASTLRLPSFEQIPSPHKARLKLKPMTVLVAEVTANLLLIE